MAAVVVSADNSRLDDAESATGWESAGSGGQAGAAEAPFAYQGSLLFNRKVTSATGGGFAYVPTNDGGVAVDMTATNRTTLMAKVIVSDWGGLDTTDGVQLMVGSASTARYVFIGAGSDSPSDAFSAYRAVGGILVIPVDPNVTAFRDGAKSTGSPTLTAVDYIGVLAAFANPSAKSENVGMDAIDIGSGLYLVGGDGADADGSYASFVAHDEGTVANRYGYAREADGGGILAYGTWRIGTDDDATSTATEFTDTTSVITWLDHLAAAGFSGVYVDLGSASTTGTDGALHIGAGTPTNVDSRPDYTVVGTSGTWTISNSLRNFRNLVFTSAVTVTGDVQCADLTQGGATLSGTFRPNSASGVAACNDPTWSGLAGLRVVQSGSGHAFEITSPGSYSLSGILWSGFGADASNAAAIYNNSGGAVTLNISGGGNTPTVRNGTGASTTVNNTKTLTFEVTFEGTPPANFEWRLYEDSATPGVVGTVELDGAETETSFTVAYAYNYTADTDVVFQVIKTGWLETLFYTTLIAADQTFPITVPEDTNL